MTEVLLKSESHSNKVNTGAFDLDYWTGLLKTDRNKAFEELVKFYRRDIYDLCVRISGNTEEAEDLTQETFIRAYEHMSGFRSLSHPRTWLYRIAINQSISFKRRLKRWRMKRADDDGEFPGFSQMSVPSSEQTTEWKILAERAHVLLKELPERQRTAVILRVIRELPYDEVSEIMNISTGGAKANVHQGLKKLRTMLED